MTKNGWTLAAVLAAMGLWTLLAWGGYAVWLLWGLGMLALLALGALARRFLLSGNPDRFPPRV